MLNLNSFMLSSPDYQKLGDFYGELLQKKPDMEDKDNSMLGYAAGNCFIMICPHDKVTDKSQNPERIIFFFETSDVDGEFNRVKNIAGVTVIKEPYHPDEEGTATVATFADPDGNYFQFVTPWKS